MRFRANRSQFLWVWLLPRLGLRQDYADWKEIAFSWPAAASWGLTLVACWAINGVWGLQIFFLGLPGWFIATAVYLALSYAQQRGGTGAEAEGFTGEEA